MLKDSLVSKRTLHTNRCYFICFICFFSNLCSFSMMIYFPVIIIPEEIHVGVEDNLNKRQNQGPEEPDINHLDVGGCWKIVAHADKHCG